MYVCAPPAGDHPRTSTSTPVGVPLKEKPYWDISSSSVTSAASQLPPVILVYVVSFIAVGKGVPVSVPQFTLFEHVDEAILAAAAGLFGPAVSACACGICTRRATRVCDSCPGRGPSVVPGGRSLGGLTSKILEVEPPNSPNWMYGRPENTHAKITTKTNVNRRAFVTYRYILFAIFLMAGFEILGG